MEDLDPRTVRVGDRWFVASCTVSDDERERHVTLSDRDTDEPIARARVLPGGELVGETFGAPVPFDILERLWRQADWAIGDRKIPRRPFYDEVLD